MATRSKKLYRKSFFVSEIFFGKKVDTLESFAKKFPSISLFSVKQTHSDRCVIYKPDLISNTIEADAIISSKAVGLYIKTADCIPVLIDGENYHAAIHAGWRGVENNITTHTGLHWFDLGESAENTKVYIGPHILQNSFEINADVKDLLLASFKKTAEILKKSHHVSVNLSEESFDDYYFEKNGKYFFDLKRALMFQLKSLGFINIYDYSVDTVTNLEYHSYRRDKDKAGRNLSFIF